MIDYPFNICNIPEKPWPSISQFLNKAIPTMSEKLPLMSKEVADRLASITTNDVQF